MFNEIQKAENKRREQALAQAKLMECPKCHSKMGEVGAVTIIIKSEPVKSGHYCSKCYLDWVSETFPKFAPTEEMIKNGEMKPVELKKSPIIL